MIEMGFSQPQGFNKGNVCAVRCRSLLAGLIGMFVFGILRIATGGIQICTGCRLHPFGVLTYLLKHGAEAFLRS